VSLGPHVLRRAAFPTATRNPRIHLNSFYSPALYAGLIISTRPTYLSICHHRVSKRPPRPMDPGHACLRPSCSSSHFVVSCVCAPGNGMSQTIPASRAPGGGTSAASCQYPESNSISSRYGRADGISWQTGRLFDSNLDVMADQPPSRGGNLPDPVALEIPKPQTLSPPRLGLDSKSVRHARDHRNETREAASRNSLSRGLASTGPTVQEVLILPSSCCTAAL
jgi:hypothetical protein